MLRYGKCELLADEKISHYVMMFEKFRYNQWFVPLAPHSLIYTYKITCLLICSVVDFNFI